MGNDYYYYVDEFNDILVFADATEYCTEVAQNAINLLENKYGIRGEGQIQVQNMSDMSAEFNSILGIITTFISFVAAISLLVGGIGVMNIRTGSILLQFLAEAAIITLLGGLIGIGLGILGGNAVGSIAGVAAKTQVSTIIGATVFSSAVGLFFGIYPARKAAKLSPIEALRHE